MYSRHTHYKSHAPSLLLVSIILVLVLLALTSTVQSAAAASPHVDRMVLNGEINPASLRFLTKAVSSAENDGARALVIEIDTPGGDLDSLKAMTQLELSSTVPIISYVSPTGGRAASAGAFVALAAQVAAMAPTTRIGASSPVTGTGGDIGSTLKSKIENDLVASMTGIQNRYGRNVALAVRMVTDAASYDDTTAVSQHIVDAGATNLNGLLTKVNGRSIKLVLDVRLPSHGVLTIGAVISLIFGALIFFNSGGPYQGPQVNPLVVSIVGAVVGVIGLSIVSVIVRVQRRRVTTGIEGMIGSIVV